MKESKHIGYILDTVETFLDTHPEVEANDLDLGFMDRTSDCVTDYRNDQLTIKIGDEHFHVTVERIES